MKAIYGRIFFLSLLSLVVLSGRSALSQEASSESGEAFTEEELSLDEPAANPAPPTAQDSASTGSKNAPSESLGTGEEPDTAGASGAITGMDFKANENGGTFVIKTDKPLAYKVRKNEKTKQFVIEIQNADLPKKFQRPYNTKEFSGPIGGINAYQKPGSRVARIVIQGKQGADFGVHREGNSILIMPSGVGGETADGEVPASPDAPMAETTPEVPDPNQEFEEGAVVAQRPVGGEEDASAKILGSNSLNDFLTGNVKFYGRPISIQVKDADIRDIFNLIAEESGLNLVLADEVKGKVTLKLRKIPWDQALIVIMQTNGLGYVRQGNILRVASLKSIKDEAETAKATLDKQRELQSLRTKIYPISFADATEMIPNIQPFLSKERGKALSDKRTNSIVVTDIVENLEKVSEIIRRLDTPTPQVLIEGKIVETSEQIDRIFGLNWQATKSGISLAYLSGGSSSTFDAAFPDFGDLTARLGILESEEKVKVLSSPRVLTVNKKKAVIEQKLSFPVKQTSTTGSTVSVSTTYVDVPLTLNVTPQVANNGMVQMEVDISRKIAGATADSASGARSLASRSANTTVMAQDGDTVVLGGIYQNDNSEFEDGFPILRKIPILGYLFKGTSSTAQRNELVIFITPTIINRKAALPKESFTSKAANPK